ncbi:MAG: L-serine ammonia-lyase, iron-sulfur-dependent, subunit beta [Firmicutes bacterium HGW-Firmicutes-1]|jgi:L-serine dehydratase|nr:MAG: L-serine ammonia-lyase, iron-sulfur-dependent, subunit beta [Firmicutes bacterium HGW-Firmicutes-1]
MNVFDIVGPIMIGPSSSHTAGAVRIGKVARTLLNEEVAEAHILLHGSFAKTYRGHGTDKALVGGIMDMLPDDIRIRHSLELAAEEGIKISFEETVFDKAHPNTALIRLTGKSGKLVTVRGASVGGGNITINNINGLEVELSCQNTTLIVVHKDTPGTIAAVTSFVAENGVNIGNFRLSREERGGLAVMAIEIDGAENESLNEQISKLPNVISSTMLKRL